MNILIHTIKYSLFTLIFFNHFYTLTSEKPKEKQIRSHKQLKLDLTRNSNQNNHHQRKISEIKSKLIKIEENQEQLISDFKNNLNKLENTILEKNQLFYNMLFDSLNNQNNEKWRKISEDGFFL
jgi:hypothetical protein